MKIDLSLTNELLYHGCKIESVAGRLNLTTPPWLQPCLPVSVTLLL